MSSIIEVKNLDFGYTPQKQILKQLSFEAARGGFLAIAGPNGVGKTTLINLLCGLLRPSSGTINIDSVPTESYSTRKLAQKIAVVRQEFVPVFDFTVAQIVSMARLPYLGTFGFESETDKQIVRESLEATETTQFALRAIGSLSGGERQRVFIARALAANSPVLLLDEPTSFLDLKHQVGIYDLLKKMQLERGKTVIVVTHDINLATQYCDEVLLLSSQNDYHIGKTEEVFTEKLIEAVYNVNGYSGKLGKGKFFLPLGKFAKDSDLISR
jgi:iron complex transport system ATP-binding protein